MIYVAIVLGVIFIVAARKVAGWVTIQRLGFASECPVLFMRSQWIYDLTYWLLLAAFVGALWTAGVPWWVILLVALFTWQFGNFLGSREGIRTYRRVCAEMIAHSDDEGMKDSLRRELAKDDASLLRSRSR